MSELRSRGTSTILLLFLVVNTCFRLDWGYLELGIKSPSGSPLPSATLHTAIGLPCSRDVSVDTGTVTHFPSSIKYRILTIALHFRVVSLYLRCC